ncbi:hypothetical protein [Ammoniphilus sp. CFH 90114]|uniref:hypothetical protein n=1 Tax=Ammoniphilus sp. CFH 90114 TaxID=2493665 RepID=UPI001010048C|nr:hypothetical protein [Ammoniphilus sp. CFH 90114]RXT02822.1 hypothetical protein EIZ39_24390 [Ammoniphilus sp. CFH 90114]
MGRSKEIEKTLWSIALPGFAQFLNSKYFKGFVFITLEVLINVQARLNQAIMYSFHGDIQKAIEVTDYGWLMIYPCLYLFAIYDAYRDAGGGDSFLFLPFVISAYMGTIGVIFSPYILGPIWLPILFLVLGAAIGIGIRNFIRNYLTNT